VLDAILLGILQGITEFLPVSSSGHLALAGILFDIKDAGLTLNVLLHVGTLVATAVVLHKRLGAALGAGLKALVKPSLFRTTEGGRDALFVVLASIPTGIIGFTIRDQVDAWTRSPTVVGVGFLITAVLLISTRFAKPGAIEHPVWQAALLLGLAQGCAVLPGISRSGTTIALALFLGVQRGRAFELSMLMSIPAVFGAALLEAPKMFSGGLSDVVPALMGAGVASISGIGAMLVLRRMVVGGSFPFFALWMLPLAVATLAMARAWPG